MSGYCKECGNQHCICGKFPKKIETYSSGRAWSLNDKELEEIKIRLLKKEKVIEQMVELIIKESSICEPDIDYTLKDVMDYKCCNCSNINICKFIIEEGLK